VYKYDKVFPQNNNINHKKKEIVPKYGVIIEP
jgi:hypothetical protein